MPCPYEGRTTSSSAGMSHRTHHVQVTAAWRAEMDRRQTTYAARRRRHMEAFFSGGERPEPPTDTGNETRRGGSTITDRRQFKLKL